MTSFRPPETRETSSSHTHTQEFAGEAGLSLAKLVSVSTARLEDFFNLKDTWKPVLKLKRVERWREIIFQFAEQCHLLAAIAQHPAATLQPLGYSSGNV